MVVVGLKQFVHKHLASAKCLPEHLRMGFRRNRFPISRRDNLFYFQMSCTILYEEGSCFFFSLGHGKDAAVKMTD